MTVWGNADQEGLDWFLGLRGKAEGNRKGVKEKKVS
jgi:hypothetical protein